MGKIFSSFAKRLNFWRNPSLKRFYYQQAFRDFNQSYFFLIECEADEETVKKIVIFFFIILIEN